MSELEKRLLDNLDDLDKNISKSAWTLLSVSVAYVAFYYGAASTKPELLGLQFDALYVFYVGAPVIFTLFQYTMISGAGTLALEEQIKKVGGSLDPRLPYIRKPTVFSLLFLFGYWATSRLQRLVFWTQVIFVLLGVMITPVVAAIHIAVWLSNNNAPWLMTWFSYFAVVACSIEALFFLIATLGKLVREARARSAESHN